MPCSRRVGHLKPREKARVNLLAKEKHFLGSETKQKLSFVLPPIYELLAHSKT
jgi:hypothetical protein